MSTFTDDRTPQLDLELPHVDNLTKVDVQRLRSMIGKIDTFLSTLETNLGTTNQNLALAVSDLEDEDQAIRQLLAQEIADLQHYGQYFGDSPTAPSTTEIGSMYLDTSVTPNVVKVLTTTGWAPAVTVSVGGRRTQDYTATAGQTGPFIVDEGFTTGDVYVNGVLLRNGSEVTLSPGASGTFTIVSALVAGDLVAFRGFLANDATDIYTKSEINTSRVRFDAAQALTHAQRGQAIANIGGGVLSGSRNKIINGCAEVIQRGSAFNISAGQAAYTADRIRIFNNTNQTLNVQCPVVIPFAGSGKHSRLRLAFATAPTSGNVFVTQRIEGADMLANGKATMSFAHAAGEVVTASCYLSQNFGSGGSAAVAPPAQNVALRNDGGIGIAKLLFDLPSTEGKIFGTNDFLEWAISIPFRSTQPLTITRMSLVKGDATAEDDPFAPRGRPFETHLCRFYFRRNVFRKVSSVPGADYYTTEFFPSDDMRAKPTVNYTLGESGNAKNFVVTGDNSECFGWQSVGAGPVVVSGVLTQDAEL